MTKVLIVGGGFGGVRAALDLAQKNLENVDIQLVSDKPYLEFSPSLYRVVVGESYFIARIPLRDIFVKKRVEIVQEVVTAVRLDTRMVIGASGNHYDFDYLILALGSETAYHDVPGLKELSFALKSIPDALRLNIHMRELFRTSREATKEEKINSLHIMIVGGGATGTELAGAIAAYSKTLARMHDIDRSFVTIDLIDSGPRILKYLHKSVSDKAERRLRRLGINIFLHRRVVRKEIEDVYLRDMRLKTLTVVWAAGVKANHLLAKAEGLSLDGAGRVIVDEFLRPKGFEGVFVIGDAASTVYSGLAQTALSDAKYVAECIKRKIKRMKLVTYEPKKPAYAIPIGPGWAAVIIGPFGFYGKIGWLLRRIADMRFLLSILPPRRVLGIFLKKSYRS